MKASGREREGEEEREGKRERKRREENEISNVSSEPTALQRLCALHSLSPSLALSLSLTHTHRLSPRY